MKGIHGLIIAIGLGIVATMFNWYYLKKKSEHTEMVYFIGVAADETIGRGEVFTKDNCPVGFYDGRICPDDHIRGNGC
ncbi:MAG: hypothetical protein V3V75_10400, partial [Thermoguttaceae bacterium]